MTTRRSTAFRRQLLSSSFGIAIAAIPLLASAPAGATQPLETFLESARKSNYDVREQTATVEQRNWERESALGRLLPAASARGVYTRNQYAAKIPESVVPGGLTITPQDQFDLFLQLDVPLVDLANYQRLGQAGHLAKASSYQLEQSQNDVQRLVARAYYAYVGGAALVQAAERAQKIAEDNLAYVTTRHSIGVATELDRERARAQVEQSKQDRAQAELIGINAARNLETVSGIAPTPVEDYPLDDLHPEAAYFTTEKGKRTAYVFFDLADVSEIPKISEPLFETFKAEIDLKPVMNQDDLLKGLKVFGERESGKSAA